MVSALPWGLFQLAMFQNSAVPTMRKRVFLNSFVLWAAQLTNKPSYRWRAHPFWKMLSIQLSWEQQSFSLRSVRPVASVSCCCAIPNWVIAGLFAPFPAGKCPVLVGRGDQAVGKHFFEASQLRASHPRSILQIGLQSAVIQFGHTGN